MDVAAAVSSLTGLALALVLGPVEARGAEPTADDPSTAPDEQIPIDEDATPLDDASAAERTAMELWDGGQQRFEAGDYRGAIEHWKNRNPVSDLRPG